MDPELVKILDGLHNTLLTNAELTKNLAAGGNEVASQLKRLVGIVDALGERVDSLEGRVAALESK
ncbi:hypothetical protein [Nocardioides aquiterrae]|uniref:P10 n=1 Tax=Nocardioides aquiterrae TaxID=203799 RepID=A0ABN1UJU4_9ACTN